jgi:hypothetical protein
MEASGKEAGGKGAIGKAEKNRIPALLTKSASLPEASLPPGLLAGVERRPVAARRAR